MIIAVYDCISDDVLTQKHGRSGAQIIRWIAPALPEAEFLSVHIAGNEPFLTPNEIDGLIISGSEKGVYDETGWMEGLRCNLQDMREAGVPMFGICFGHQILADLFGGKAEKVDRGFVVGTLAVEDNVKSYQAHLAHQDQVTKVPEGATVIASASHCPVAALSYDFPALSVQFHPEYDEIFLRDLIDIFGPKLLAEGDIETARKSVRGGVPPDLYHKELATFFRENI